MAATSLISARLAGKNTLANVFMQWSYYASPRRRADLTEVIEGTLDTVQYNGRFGELFNRRETSACANRDRGTDGSQCESCAWELGWRADSPQPQFVDQVLRAIAMPPRGPSFLNLSRAMERCISRSFE